MRAPLELQPMTIGASLTAADLRTHPATAELDPRLAETIALAPLSTLQFSTPAATIRTTTKPVRVNSWNFIDDVWLGSERSAALSALSTHRHATRGVEAVNVGGHAELPRPTLPSALTSPNPRFTPTRIRPPRDVVKLEDRLHQLLQPPLESLLATQQLEFPANPFPYQLDGVAFLYPRHHAVLADEMGLGKTMQAITALRLLVHSGQARRILLVCPKPLVTNWQRELASWAPELSVTAIGGPQERRNWQWQTSQGVVTLANYETIVRDAEVLSELNSRYDLVVLDEAQRIKNHSGATSAAVRAMPRARSWALTGTPIENSIDDLVGIFEFVAPGTLHSEMKHRTITRAVRDIVLRRTKEQVLKDLPPKLIHDEHIDLTPEQWESYQRAEEDGVIHLNELRTELTIQHVFELVLRLKQICNFDPVTGASSKVERLTADLEECTASGRKAIVFSQWVQTIERLAAELAPFGPLQFHGRIPNSRRDAVLRQFRDDPACQVLLLSYGTGSVGLNLQFASYVFLFDRWWNPAVEDQAINRAHRIGASGPVTVTRYVAEGTIEQRIDETLTEKRALFDEVLGDTIGPASLHLSRQEILSLFNLHSPNDVPREAA
jgi:SNF2 family DNA or RNA helicase